MADTATRDRRAAVLAALTSVVDPCSQFNGSHLDLVELGMIDGVAVGADGVAQITLLLDDPTCLYAATICREVSAAAGAVAGVNAVEVTIRADELWTAARLSEAAQRKLAAWRERRDAIRQRTGRSPHPPPDVMATAVDPPLPSTPGLWLELGDDAVATLTIDRPSKANTIDKDMHARLTTLWSELAALPAVGAIVLTGTGAVFCGGGDRNGWADLIEDRGWRHRKMQEARAIVYDMLRCEVPIVGAITGPAIGLGSSLALACDAIVMAEEAYFLDPHVPTGLVAGDGGASLLPALAPVSVARKMLFTGHRLTAPEALRCFLATEVVPFDTVLPTAHALAAVLAAQPRQALRQTKRAMNLTLLDAISASLEFSSASEESSFDEPEYHARIGYHPTANA